MHHFFVRNENIDSDGKKIIIDGDDVNHIKNVLRMKAGEEVLLSNGEGSDYVCVIRDIGDIITTKITDKEYDGSELNGKIYLFQGLPKADKMEYIIQKAVELGVYEIIPVNTKRCIVKLDKKKADNKIKRWNAISLSAAKQSRRSIIPKVLHPMNFKDALEYAKNFDLKLIPYENFKDLNETKNILDGLKSGESIAVFIGPEGGFEEEEVALASNNGVKKISLGNRILRTETAPLMILSVLGYKLEFEKKNEI
ncbi:16S rRNA (uracil1498-N3)-methyltransferase [Lachnospiraceae bacterium RM5]|nr:16S rRNA (uracil1498-N3)-methyltransferase [Lachnospiraceae bacterium RM5]